METSGAAEHRAEAAGKEGQPPGAGQQGGGPPGPTRDSPATDWAQTALGPGPSSTEEAAAPQGLASEEAEQAHAPGVAQLAAEGETAEPQAPSADPGGAVAGPGERQEPAAPAGHDEAGGLGHAPSEVAAAVAAEEPTHTNAPGDGEAAKPAQDAAGVHGVRQAAREAAPERHASEPAAGAEAQQPEEAPAVAPAEEGEAGTQPAGDAGEAAEAAIGAPAAPPEPPAPIVPGVDEEQHPLKPQWRRGYTAATTQFLFVTVTQGDCNSRRMRPPRAWYDALMGGAFGTFEVEVVKSAENGGGENAGLEDASQEKPAKYYLQAHAYDYCKSEYYVQGSECKNLFRALALQPGDGLVLLRCGALDTGMPCVKARVIRAANNPHAPLILNAAASAQSRRLAAAADPSRKRAPKRSAGAPAPANRKRKMAPTRATDGMASYTPDLDGAEPEGGGRAKRSVRSRRFPYGDDFVTGQKQFWDRGAAAAAAADEEAGGEGRGEEDEDMLLVGERDHDRGADSDAAISDDSGGPGPGGANRVRGGLGRRSPEKGPLALAAAGGRPPPKSPLLAVAAAAAVQQEEERRASPEKPRVMALKVEGRNVLRIKLGFKRTAAQAGLGGADVGNAAAAAPSAAAAAAPCAGAGEPSSRAQPAGGRALPAAAAAAAACERREAGGSTGKEDADEEALDTLVALAASLDSKPDSKPAAGHDVTLLSKSLVRDDEGRVVAAQLRLGWEPEKTAFSHISRQISEFGARHHHQATVEDFEVQPAEHQIRVTLRVAEAGKVDVLERAVRDLVAML